MRLYGIAEIARAIDTPPNTVKQWHLRGKPPESDVDPPLRMGPAWSAERIEPWIRRHRLGQQRVLRYLRQLPIGDHQRTVTEIAHRLAVWPPSEALKYIPHCTDEGFSGAKTGPTGADSGT